MATPLQYPAGTRRALEDWIDATGVRRFGLFEWRPFTLDVVTIGALTPQDRATFVAVAPFILDVQFHDSPRGPLADLQRRIDAARDRLR